jgi:hypothetical protein
MDRAGHPARIRARPQGIKRSVDWSHAPMRWGDTRSMESDALSAPRGRIVILGITGDLARRYLVPAGSSGPVASRFGSIPVGSEAIDARIA